MRITSEQLLEMMRARKSRKAAPPAKIRIGRAMRCVGKFLVDCFDGPAKTVHPFGVAAGGLI